jgi:hypothetical protein
MYLAGRSQILQPFQWALTERHAKWRAGVSAGVEFIDENGGGQGARLRKRQRAKQSK